MSQLSRHSCTLNTHANNGTKKHRVLSIKRRPNLTYKQNYPLDEKRQSHKNRHFNRVARVCRTPDCVLCSNNQNRMKSSTINGVIRSIKTRGTTRIKMNPEKVML